MKTGWIRALIIVMMLVAESLILSCSPVSRYRVLSFFFDGVPDPNAPKVQEDTLQVANRPSQDQLQRRIRTPQYVFHPPYQQKACDSCHDLTAGSRLLEPVPQLCYTCHDDFSEQYPFLHGPVSAGYCMECHNAHMTENPKLLLRKGRDICLYCHSKRDVFANEVHADLDDETSCLDCHNPHGGEDRFILN